MNNSHSSDARSDYSDHRLVQALMTSPWSDTGEDEPPEWTLNDSLKYDLLKDIIVDFAISEGVLSTGSTTTERKWIDCESIVAIRSAAQDECGLSLRRIRTYRYCHDRLTSNVSVGHTPKIAKWLADGKLARSESAESSSDDHSFITIKNKKPVIIEVDPKVPKNTIQEDGSIIVYRTQTDPCRRLLGDRPFWCEVPVISNGVAVGKLSCDFSDDSTSLTPSSLRQLAQLVDCSIRC